MSWSNAYIGLSFEACGGCWGLIHKAFAAHSIAVPVYGAATDAAEREEIERIASGASSIWHKIRIGQECALDVALFMTPGEPPHAGIVVTHGRMLHVTRNRDSCVERFRTAFWSPSLNRGGIFRHDALVIR